MSTDAVLINSDRLIVTIRRNAKASDMSIDERGMWLDMPSLTTCCGMTVQADQTVVAPGPEPEPVPESVTDYQFAWQASAEGIITRDEALAWTARGEVPATLQAAVNRAVPDPDERFGVQMLLVGAKTYQRQNSLVPLLGAVFNKDAAGLDQFWRDASKRGV